jgi:steroid delta-isomerase-like uncharacterized protein
MKKAIALGACSVVFASLSAGTASPTPTKVDLHVTACKKGSPKAILQALVSAFDRHDFAAIDTLLSPQGVYEDFAADFHGVGPAPLKEFLRGVIEEEPDFNWKIVNIIESGCTVAAEWTWTGTYTGEGVNGKHVVAEKISSRGATFAVIENAQIKQVHDYYDFESFFTKSPATSR